MKKRIGFYLPCIVILGFIAGSVTSVGALELLVETQEASNAIVPNVTGIPSDVAAQILQVAGLNAKIQRGSSRSLTVDSQEPKAGTLAAAGSTVVLAVGGAAIKTSTQVLVPVPKNSQNPEILAMQKVPERKMQTQSNVILTKEPSSVYITSESLRVKTFLAWYPKRFLTNGQSAVSSSRTTILGTPAPDGHSNIFKADPLNAGSGDRVPIIMERTQGWQYGWVQ